MIIPSRYAIFNNWNFNNIPGLQVYAITPPGQAKRNLNLFPVARTSARKLSSAFFQGNTLTLGVYITAASRETLEAAMDTLYANIQATEGALVIPRSGGTARQYTATYSTSTVNNAMSNVDSPASNYADLTLTFECSDSFGYDQFFTPILTLANQNSSPNQWNYTQGGGADQQVPFLQLYFTGGSLGVGTVTIGNLNSGQQISITRTFSVGDTLQINPQNNTVQVNGVDVAFTGAIPTFGLGLQTITYSDTFTSRILQFYSYVFNRWN